ncbi:MAG: response regulator transcription factor [Chloroflexota bacterium]
MTPGAPERLPSARRILVVEDDPSIRALCADVLRDQGYRVETAVDGQDGLDHLGNHPDLIVLDLTMPVVDGREFLRQLHAGASSHAPVLVLTADFGVQTLRGAKQVMQKPFEISALLDVVARLLPEPAPGRAAA